MLALEQIKGLARASASKIVLVVIDGLGGLPHPESGKTELECADTPNLDRIARDSVCGLIDLVSPGITPGSAPGHLALFGYDPVRYNIGRGVLEALGIDLKLMPSDIAARGNFCTVDESGVLTDRRAGRIPTDKAAQLCRSLSEVKVGGAELMVVPVREHRFVVVLRGEGLSADLTDSDPQRTGLLPRAIEPLKTEAARTAHIANQFVAQAGELLKGESPANMLLMRGFSRRPDIPPMAETYRLTPAAIAVYPMYRGLARLVGMEVLAAGQDIAEELDCLERHYADHDFFFVHYKPTDSRGEDGDFDGKVRALEELDRFLPRLLALAPDVLVVTGDHSTPATLGMHSWHPVPFMLLSSWCRPDSVTQFSEPGCLAGGMGRFPAVDIMPLAMANALKLDKFGA